MGKLMLGTERPGARKYIDSLYEKRRLKSINKQIDEITKKR